MRSCSGSGDGQRERGLGADTTSWEKYRFSGVEVGCVSAGGYVRWVWLGLCENHLIHQGWRRGPRGQVHLGTSVRVVPAACSHVRQVQCTIPVIEALKRYQTISVLASLNNGDLVNIVEVTGK